MSTINETYFGIRIGDPRRNKCYLWVGEDGFVPKLFPSREEAEEILGDGWDVSAKVVRVKIKSG